jgi:polyphosphate kinase 2 (PPK2 family)
MRRTRARRGWEKICLQTVKDITWITTPEKIGVGGVRGFREGRYENLNTFEKYLVRSSLIVLMYFPKISKDERKRRHLPGPVIGEHTKNYQVPGIAEWEYRDNYRDTCDEMLDATSGYAPCLLVPADQKGDAPHLCR